MSFGIGGLARRRIPLLTIAAATAFAAYLVNHALRGRVLIDGSRYTMLGDDILISLRYAYNLASGYGLVWNPGEAVLGITNLGWTLVASVFYLLGASLVTAPLLLRLLNILLHAGLVALLSLWCWRRGNTWAGVIAAALVAVDAPIMMWGLLGFETTAQALLITVAVLPLLDDRPIRWTLVLAALATIIRPDSLVVYVILLVIALAVDRGRAMALPLAVSIALLATLFSYQRAVYGEWLPNTYALKATGGAGTLWRGFAYLWRFSWEETFALPLLCAPFAFLLWRAVLRGEISRRLVLASSLPAVWITYVVWIGGDAFPYGRFFVALIPLWSVFVGLLVEDMAKALRRSRLTAAPLARGLTLAALTLFVGSLAAHVRIALPILREAQEPFPAIVSVACLALGIQNMELPDGRVIGVYFAGMTPYLLPQHRAHDFLGKSDRHIARSRPHPGPPGHNKWDYEYSLGVVRPDLIVTAAPFGAADQIEVRHTENDYGFHPALWLSPIFQAEYRPYRLWPPIGEGAWHHQWVYARAGFVSPTPLRMPTGICQRGP